MEIEKIKKLLFSTNLMDKRLGVEFLAKYGSGTKNIFLELGAIKSKNYEESPYSYKLEYPARIEDIEDLDHTYVAKNYYYYEISTECIFIDTPSVGKKRIDEKETTLLEGL